ncbi:MAG: glycosyltransferase family 2 protein [Solobacterium sp.]|nr:glycosyltransferase family 2 protein [Solobacterium sp.]
MKPLVSIITPCYNGEKYADRYFRSVLSQTYPCLELIFVNDGSTDRTEEIALSYKDALENKGIKYTYLYQENAGQAAALNNGLKIFQGDYLVWPDSDDEITPDSIEKRVAFLENHPNLGIMRSNGIVVNDATGEKRRIDNKNHSEAEDLYEDIMLLRTYGNPGPYMIRRSLLLECYPDLDIFVSRTGQNWQIYVPAFSRSLCGYLDEDLFIIHEHDDSHSRYTRSAEAEYKRWHGFTEILLKGMEAGIKNTDYYKNLVKENEARQIFYYAVSVRDIPTIKTEFRNLKTYGKPTMKESLLYLKCLLGM